MKELKFADGVWHRVVQIVQEAFLTGTDVSDHLRQIRVVASSEDDGVLKLSPAYEQYVKETHEKLLQHAREAQAQQSGNKFIVPGSGGASSN